MPQKSENLLEAATRILKFGDDELGLEKLLINNKVSRYSSLVRMFDPRLDGFMPPASVGFPWCDLTNEAPYRIWRLSLEAM